MRVNPVRELRSLTVCADGGFVPPLGLIGDDRRLKSAAFSNGVNIIRKLLLSISMVFLVTLCAYAQVQDYSDAIDRNELDYHLFKSLKEQFGKSDDEIYQAMGLMHIEHEDWERAATYFKKAVGLNPKLYLSWHNLGLLYIDKEEGGRYLDKAIDADPDFPTSYYWLAYFYCRQNKNNEAIKVFKEYLKVAEGIPSETARRKSVSKILAELFSDKEGEELWKIIKLDW